MGRSLLLLVLLGCGSGAFAQNAAPWETWQPPAYQAPQPNGYDGLLAAAEVLGRLGPVDPQTAPEEQQRKLEQLQPVFDRVTTALQHDSLAPQVLSFDLQMPYLRPLRDLARTYIARAAFQASAGDRAAAIHSDLDAYALGNAVGRGGVLIHLLVGLACQGMATHDLSARVYTLAREDAALALPGLQALASRPLPWQPAIEAERTCAILHILQTVKLPGNDPAAQKVFLETNWRPLNEAYDHALAQARLPWPARGQKPVATSAYEAELVPHFGAVLYRLSRSETETQFLIARLALWLYYCDHDCFPPKLEALVPTYLPTLPQDPFADRPLRYQPRPKGFRLWSVADDGVDQEGMPKGKPDLGVTGDFVDELTL